MSSLAAVPDKLGSLFTGILAHCEKGTIEALRWVLYSERPLSPTELFFAIKTSTNQISTGQWDEGDADQESIKRFITRSSRGLLGVYEEFLWRVYFIHGSVREHLLQGGLASLTMADTNLVEGSAHADIAQHCLSYLQLDSPKYLQYFEPHRSLSWFSSNRFPLHRYAVHNLLYHADLA